jgi:nuclear pore complex protein Nup133
MSPQDVVGACTDELDHRFLRLDASMREEIMRDMQVEDDRLKPYIQRCRLDKWYQAALDLAKEDFTREIENETDQGQKLLSAAQKLREIERGIAENEKRNAESQLHSKARYKTRPLEGKAGKFQRSKRY